MALSKRLFSLLTCVEKGSVVADIGCDHGLLAMELINQGIAKHVYACDLREGPLARAIEAVKRAGLEANITTLLKNGMDDLSDDVDTVVIAGMGFDTIQMILEAHLDTLPKYKRFIIQSNKHVEDLRRWISDHHFTIEQELLVEEDHYYPIVVFHCGYHESYDEDELFFGVYLENHPLFHEYWQHRLAKVDFALSQMPPETAQSHALMMQKKRILKKLSD